MLDSIQKLHNGRGWVVLPYFCGKLLRKYIGGVRYKLLSLRSVKILVQCSSFSLSVEYFQAILIGKEFMTSQTGKYVVRGIICHARNSQSSAQSLKNKLFKRSGTYKRYNYICGGAARVVYLSAQI